MPIAAQISLVIDGEKVLALPGETLLQTADRHETEIPRLCYKEGYRADGNCRACVVDIAGERALSPSCCRVAEEGMKVNTRNDRARHAQKMVVELLLSDVADEHYTTESELDKWAQKLGITDPRFRQRDQPSSDKSHPAITVNLDACIQCTRCVRACREEQVNDVIGYAGRGGDARIVFDIEEALGSSTCVGCGECVQACPTGALMPARNVGLIEPDKKVDSVCPYCGVGCLLTYHVKDDRILYVTGKDGPANRGRLCVKGRYGFDYVSHPDRLKKPLIRKDGLPKLIEANYDPADPLSLFRETSWDEALDFAANGLSRIRDDFGGGALAGFGSAKGSNEEAYLFQKLVRTGFGSNNVDHCTRLCHASSVAALLEGIGSAAVSNQVDDVSRAECILVIGSNTPENHPVASTFIKNAARAGTSLIVLDPRRTDLARHASHYLQFTPDTDVALLNAMMHTIIEEGLVDAQFIASRTAGFELIKQNIAGFSPEAMENVCGIAAETIRAVARLYATSKTSMIFWGMGVSQHVHGTDNARCLIALSLMTGQIGRPGTGLHPLRGQNNVQGASDAGLIPMVFPDYQRVDNEEARARFEELWGASLDPNPGLTVVEIMNAILDSNIRGMYIMGENPAMSDPNLNHARQALAKLEHLVVQDLFLTETAMFADVILPASAFPEKTGSFTNTDRRIQLGRQALSLPGQTRQDLDIIQAIATRLGLEWDYPDAATVFEEMRLAMPTIGGITWSRLLKEESVTYPCLTEDDPGQAVVFASDFPTSDGLAKFVPARLTQADELPDAEFPFVLITGRQLEHWHTGAMTRRASVLSAIEPSPVINIHPEDLLALNGHEDSTLLVSSRRGKISASARTDSGMRRGEIFIPFCYHEAAANLLTNEALDPFGKIPEFKYCAVQIAVEHPPET